MKLLELRHKDIVEINHKLQGLKHSTHIYCAFAVFGIIISLTLGLALSSIIAALIVLIFLSLIILPELWEYLERERKLKKDLIENKKIRLKGYIEDKTENCHYYLMKYQIKVNGKSYNVEPMIFSELNIGDKILIEKSRYSNIMLKYKKIKIRTTNQLSS